MLRRSRRPSRRSERRRRRSSTSMSEERSRSSMRQPGSRHPPHHRCVERRRVTAASKHCGPRRRDDSCLARTCSTASLSSPPKGSPPASANSRRLDSQRSGSPRSTARWNGRRRPATAQASSIGSIHRMARSPSQARTSSAIGSHADDVALAVARLLTDGPINCAAFIILAEAKRWAGAGSSISFRRSGWPIAYAPISDAADTRVRAADARPVFSIARIVGATGFAPRSIEEGICRPFEQVNASHETNPHGVQLKVSVRPRATTACVRWTTCRSLSTRGETLGVVGDPGRKVGHRTVADPAPDRQAGAHRERLDPVRWPRHPRRMSDKEIRDVRGREISMIFQDPMTSLNPVLTIGRQITEILEVQGGMTRPRRGRERSNC